MYSKALYLDQKARGTVYIHCMVNILMILASHIANYDNYFAFR